MSVPEDYKSEKRLRQVFGESIRRIWITSDCKELEKKVEKRDKLAFKLETAETKYIRAANSTGLKIMKKGDASMQDSFDCERHTPAWASTIRRPTRRLGFLGIFGKKVDAIRSLRSELKTTIEEVDVLQEKHKSGQAKQLSAVFIEFESQSDAQIALQTLSHHQPLHMTPRFIGISPKEVVWSALNISWWQRIMRKFAVKGGITALIIFWSVPAAIVGLISNISYLTKLVPFLKFIDDLPDVIKGIIAGLLPSAALALLMSLVPIICRSMFDTPVDIWFYIY